MELNMHYKTIVLELLLQRLEMHNKLRSKRMLLPMLHRYAKELKANHENWKEYLSQTKPSSDPSQIASEALEIALQELEDSLQSGIPPEANESLSLEGVMAFVRGRTPLA
jgi:hypothetical protein